MPTRDPKGRGHVPNNNSGGAGELRAGYRAAAGDRKSQDQRWAAVTALHGDCVSDAVDAVTAAGDAIQFGRSRDGGAYSITLYTPAGRVVIWANTPNEALSELLIIIEDARAIAGD